MRVLLVVTATVVLGMSAVIGQSGATRAPRNVAEFDELFRQVSNWAAGAKTISSAPRTS